ncbi:MAG: hypothetical protein INR65_13725, partial [Gluconacetobacter diazotrophicus]|nr:hypothetical protein [Gluconacetobacter diazotrophicus]
LAISVFGGIAQFAETALIALTGDPLMPAWYMSGFVVLGLAAMLRLRETAPNRIAAGHRPCSRIEPGSGVENPS